MRFSCDKAPLLDLVKKVKRVAPSKSDIPALCGILTEADEDTGELTLTATNYEVSFQCTVKVSVEEGGKAVIAADLFLGMLELLPDGFVDFHVLPNHILRVTAGPAVYEIMTLSSGEYPTPEIPAPEQMVKITGLPQLVSQASFAVATSSSQKVVLHCIKLEIGKDSMRAITSDMARLVKAYCPVESGGSLEVLVPASSLKLLASIVENGDELQAGLTRGTVVFRKEGLVFSARIMPDQYLDADAVLSAIDRAYAASVEAPDLLRALESAQVISDLYAPVKLEFKKKEIVLRCDGENGKGYDEVPAEVTTPTPRGGFHYNVDDLQEGVRRMGGYLNLSISSQGWLLMENGVQVYMQTPVRPKKRVKADEKTDGKKAKTAAKRKTGKKAAEQAA